MEMAKTGYQLNPSFFSSCRVGKKSQLSIPDLVPDIDRIWKSGLSENTLRSVELWQTDNPTQNPIIKHKKRLDMRLMLE
jgi:hypothetical protein